MTVAYHNGDIGSEHLSVTPNISMASLGTWVQMSTMSKQSVKHDSCYSTVVRLVRVSVPSVPCEIIPDQRGSSFPLEIERCSPDFVSIFEPGYSDVAQSEAQLALRHSVGEKPKESWAQHAVQAFNGTPYNSDTKEVRQMRPIFEPSKE